MDEQGASSSEDRATHEQSQQAVSAVPVGIPSANQYAAPGAQPCPFCEGKDLSCKPDDRAHAAFRYFVQCEEECFAQGPRAATPEVAIALWNEGQGKKPVAGIHDRLKSVEAEIKRIARIIRRLESSTSSLRADLHEVAGYPDWLRS